LAGPSTIVRRRHHNPARQAPEHPGALDEHDHGGPERIGWRGRVLGRLFDLADSTFFDAEPHAFTRAGHHLEIPPGATEELDVVLLTRGVWHLPTGDYGIDATIAALGLEVADGILRIVER
jgi:hypothetical protein